MEMTEYETPVSWDDRGMDWTAPDPRRADYAMAIREATLERLAASERETVSDSLFRVSPFRTLSRRAMEAVLNEIGNAATSFVNLEREYAEDLSDFPSMWTLGDLANACDGRLFALPNPGLVCKDGGGWLREVRLALDRLTVVVPRQTQTVILTRSGRSAYRMAFEPALAGAVSAAASGDGGRGGSYYEQSPMRVFGWTSSTHWSQPVPNWGGKPEDNIDTYYSHARGQSLEVRRVRNRLAGARFDVFAAVVAAAPDGTLPESTKTVLERSDFDAGSSGLVRGLNWTERVRTGDGEEFSLTVGDRDAIPSVSTVPQSEFDPEHPNLTLNLHTTKRGWDGNAWVFADYAVEGGFRFRPEEKSDGGNKQGETS